MKVTPTTTASDLAPQDRTYIRLKAGCHSLDRAPVVLVDGDSPPEEVYVNRTRYQTKTGLPIRHSSAYAKRGWSSMVYVGYGRHVTVGRDWLRDRI